MASRSARRPLPFNFVYRDAEGIEHTSPVFRARPWKIRELPWTTLLLSPLRLFAVRDRVFREALGDEWPQFNRFIHDPGVSVEIDDLTGVIKWLVEARTGRRLRS